jgi:hypothetical protein
MSRIYHPDKHNSGFTGMSDEEAVEIFPECAQLFTRDNVTDTEERNKYERTNYEFEL